MQFNRNWNNLFIYVKFEGRYKFKYLNIVTKNVKETGD